MNERRSREILEEEIRFPIFGAHEVNIFELSVLGHFSQYFIFFGEIVTYFQLSK